MLVIHAQINNGVDAFLGLLIDSNWYINCWYFCLTVTSYLWKGVCLLHKTRYSFWLKQLLIFITLKQDGYEYHRGLRKGQWWIEQWNEFSKEEIWVKFIINNNNKKKKNDGNSSDIDHKLWILAIHFFIMRTGSSSASGHNYCRNKWVELWWFNLWQW